MEPKIISQLFALNRRFYQTFAHPFAETRRRIQPGVRRYVKTLFQQGNWLDLGCGSGTLAVEWAHDRLPGLYWGADFSQGLLDEAREAVDALQFDNKNIRFSMTDFEEENWERAFTGTRFDGVALFAVLHHIPGSDLRRNVLQAARSLLPAGGWLVHSEWQFQHSPKLMARRLPWETIGLGEEELEAGDTLLDWRHASVDMEERTGMRYVHLFSREELLGLAKDCSFEIVDEFESDGNGGRLNLYQTWKAI